jgi:hypothetical protein
MNEAISQKNKKINLSQIPSKINKSINIIHIDTYLRAPKLNNYLLKINLFG